MAIFQPELSRTSLDKHLSAGLLLVVLMLCGAGAWAATAQIAGAVVATGNVVVESNVKKVQHPTGGVVSELRVRDGERVEAGEILIRLDNTVALANLAIVTKQLDELSARKSRLEAERDGSASVTFPSALLERLSDREVAGIIAGERKLFESRRAARLGQQSQLRQRVEQLSEEIRGHTAQDEAKLKEIALIERELTGTRELWTKNLLPITRLTVLERECARVNGEHGQLIAAIASARGKIAETELQILQIDRDLSSEVMKDIRDADAKFGELIERKVTAEDQLKRIDLRAPLAGLVHQSMVHTVGGVINAGETIMQIVPLNDTLTVELHIAPQDIDQVRVGSEATLRFTAFNRANTPEITGSVSFVAADTTVDPTSGRPYYRVQARLAASELAMLKDVQIIPGMPVEAFIVTGSRTLWSYLMAPLRDQVFRAFRER
jgi:HlyD family secretion protein